MPETTDYFARYEDEGEFRWPDDPAERDQVASMFLGEEIVAKLDYWVRLAVELITNPEASLEYRRRNSGWERDQFFRDGLANLEPQEKQIVIALVRKVASGVVFSTLVAFDQFPEAILEIKALDQETEEQLATILPGTFGLHERFHDWIEKFSESAEDYKQT